ncbi:DEAD-like helicases family protein, partial [Yasminevirus sp. GU-2018]
VASRISTQSFQDFQTNSQTFKPDSQATKQNSMDFEEKHEQTDSHTEEPRGSTHDDESRATNFGSQSVEEGATREMWNRIEIRMPPQQMTVIASLKQMADAVNKGHGDSNVSVENAPKRVLGEKFYMDIRPDLVASKLVKPAPKKKVEEVVDEKVDDGKKPKKEKKIKEPVVKKADKIRADNAASSIKKEIASVTSSFSFDNLQPNLAFNSHFIEVVGLGFVYMARFMLSKADHFKKEKNVKQVWSMMVSMQRFIQACANYVGVDPVNPSAKMPISQSFIDDMNACYNDIDAVFYFDGVVVCRRAPELLVYAPLDQYVRATAIKPRDHQFEIVKKVCDNMKNGFFIVYNAMINSGKTTAVVPLTDVAKQHGKKLMCVCNLETVREQMCNMLYNANANFAIGYIRHDGAVKLSQTWSKKGERVDAIVCDPVTAKKLLSDPKEIASHGPADQYIIFHDEPTVYADIANSAPLRKNVLVQMNPPPYFIYSSATAPTVEELDVIIAPLRSKCPTLYVGTVYSPTVQVGCEVRTEDGELVVPYIGCKTAEDIHSTIKKIRETPFLGRMLTTEVALHLWAELNKIGVANVPDIPVLFRKVSNMKADTVREVVIEMLILLAKLPSAQIEQICSSKLLELKSEKKSPAPKVEEDVGFAWEEDEEEKTPDAKESLRKVDYKTLGTSHIWRGMTLYVATDPYRSALEMFRPLIDALHEERVRSASHMIGIYDRDYSEWETAKEKALKNMEVSEQEKALKEREIDDMVPSLKFPAWGQIGTLDHCKRFVPKKYHSQVLDTRPSNSGEAIIGRKIEISKGQSFRFVDGTKVDDDVLLLLFCGVGIYAPSNPALDQPYNDVVLEYANAGKLAYVIADNSITFGTNQPYGRVMISDDFSSRHSVYTLFQLMGRAGRVGKFPRAEAVVSDEAGRLLIDFTIHPEKYNIEVRNITNMIHQIETEQKEAIEAQIRRMEQEVLASTAKASISAVSSAKFEFIPASTPVPTSPPTSSDSTPVKSSASSPSKSPSKAKEVVSESWEDFEEDEIVPVKLDSKTVPLVPLCDVVSRPKATQTAQSASVKSIPKESKVESKTEIRTPVKPASEPVAKSEPALSWRTAKRDDRRNDDRQEEARPAPVESADKKKYVPPALRQSQSSGFGSSSGARAETGDWRSGGSNPRDARGPSSSGFPASRSDSRSDPRSDSWRSGARRDDSRGGNGGSSGYSGGQSSSQNNRSWRS